MKAIRAHDWCEPKDLVLEEIEKPVPGPGEVLVRVRAAALNFPDMLMIRGAYQVKPPLPFTPGMEFAGEVEELGAGVDGPLVGRRVMAQTGLGAFAEYALAPAAAVRPLLDGMSDEQAAGFPLVYQTSYFGIVFRGQMRPGETVLVHSAAGGVGLAALQIAKAKGAGRIIATVGSDEKKQIALENGADDALNYETEDFPARVKELTDGRGADVIYDPVGGEVSAKSAKCVAFDGRIVIVGFTSGDYHAFASNHILIKNYSVVGLHWGNYKLHKPEMIEEAWEDLGRLHQTGLLKSVVAARYPMERVAEAMEFLASRRAVGKIILNW